MGTSYETEKEGSSVSVFLRCFTSFVFSDEREYTHVFFAEANAREKTARSASKKKKGLAPRLLFREG